MTPSSHNWDIVRIRIFFKDASITSLLFLVGLQIPGYGMIPSPSFSLADTLDQADQSAFPWLWFTFTLNYTNRLIPFQTISMTSGLLHLTALSWVPVLEFFPKIWSLCTSPRTYQSRTVFLRKKIQYDILFILLILFLMYWSWSQFLISAALYRCLIQAGLYRMLEWIFPIYKPFSQHVTRILLLIIFSLLIPRSPLHDWSFLFSLIGANWTKILIKHINPFIPTSGLSKVLTTHMMLSGTLSLLLWPITPWAPLRVLINNLWGAPLSTFWITPTLILFKIWPCSLFQKLLEHGLGLFHVLLQLGQSSWTLDPWIADHHKEWYLLLILWFSWICEDWQISFMRSFQVFLRYK